MSNAKVTPNIKDPGQSFSHGDRAMLLGQRDPYAMPKVRLNRVMAFVDANVAQNLCVTTLASVAGMSPFYFCRSFKQSTGITPHRYVLHRRMEQARHLLEQKAMPLLEIARQVGFTDQSQFTRVFHKMVGITPSQYRKAKTEQ